MPNHNDVRSDSMDESLDTFRHDRKDPRALESLGHSFAVRARDGQFYRHGYGNGWTDRACEAASLTRSEARAMVRSLPEGCAKVWILVTSGRED